MLKDFSFKFIIYMKKKEETFCFGTKKKKVVEASDIFKNDF